MANYDVLLDASGLTCPMPVMKCSKDLRKMAPGQVLYMKATDPASVDDLNTMLKGTSNTLLESSQSGGAYHFYIKKG
jgi:tRNA 2-thiouridine synthesizing protein A